jgi:hypothetical protein
MEKQAPIQPADFFRVGGQWTADPEFDEIVAVQRQIDWDKWNRTRE